MFLSLCLSVCLPPLSPDFLSLLLLLSWLIWGKQLCSTIDSQAWASASHSDWKAMKPDNHRMKPLKPWATVFFLPQLIPGIFSQQWMTNSTFFFWFYFPKAFLDPCNFIYNCAVNKPPGIRLPKFFPIWLTQTEENFHSHLILLPDMTPAEMPMYCFKQGWPPKPPPYSATN